MFNVRVTRIVFRSAIAVIFFYFGVLALKDPTGQAGIWMRPQFASLITAIVPVSFFMITFGIAQILVAVGMIFGLFLRFVLPIAALMLLGIVINLWFSDIALRDLALLTGVIYLISEEYSKN